MTKEIAFLPGDLVRISPENKFAQLAIENNVSPEDFRSFLEEHFEEHQSPTLDFIVRMIRVVKNNEIGMVVNSYQDHENVVCSRVLFPSGNIGMKNHTLLLVKHGSTLQQKSE